QIAATNPQPLRKIDPHIPRDLETMVLKAMAKEPGQRYLSAGGLAEDLTRFLADRPIKARRSSLSERTWRWVRRNRLLTGMGASIVFLLLFMTVGSLWTAWWYRDQLTVTRGLEDQGRHRLYDALVAQ